MRRLQFCLAVLALLALTCSAFAQVQNGQFTGTVTDPSGAAVPNAKVTVTNQGTGLSVSITTNQSGLYIAKELPVGTYKLTTEASGFKTVSDTNVVLNAGTVAHVDFKMTLGQAKEVVEVTGAAAVVQTEDTKLSTTVGSDEINNLVLNGRNVYDLMSISAGAVNVAGTDFEPGHGTVVNGVRENFNGFLINGVSNKGLSGGVVNTPIQDTVEEFQQLDLNMSAQYGSSAGSNVNLVTKSGTNNFHGSAWEYIRNDALDANDYFLNQSGVARPPLRWNQFGFTLGGPIVKDKLFYFVSYQGSRFTTVGAPNPIVIDSADWRNAVHQADLGNANGPGGANGVPTTSVADFLYGHFVPNVPQSTPLNTLDQFITGGGSTTGFTTYADFLCPDSYSALGATSAQAAALAGRMQSVLGVVPSVDNAVNLVNTGAPCSVGMTQQNGTVRRDPVTGISTLPFQVNSVSLFKSQTGSGANSNLFNGNEYSGRIDYNWNAANRLSVGFNWSRETDTFGPCGPSCTRGFHNPTINRFPNGQLSYVHTFSPTILNEFKAGYSQNVTLTSTSAGGVPSIGFDDGSVGFGSYNGYPQYFKENVYSYGDMVSVTHGNHNMKMGVDFRRNIENSVFDVTRPSYYFTDPIFFAADASYGMAAGVDPGICSPPCSQSSIQQLVSSNTIPNGSLSENKRHWRNLEFGAYFQDDWKATKRLTLQLGLRYDLYRRHNELNNLATTFVPGPGSNLLQGVVSANALIGTPGCDTNAAQEALAQLQGVCGPGGFAASATLGKGRHKDFGPRIGFAYDLFGNGKTAIRGGFGISYEGTLYNPLSNSRWNLPYYSFDSASNFLGGDVNQVVYGPTTCVNFAGCVPAGGALYPFTPGNSGTGAPPAFTGPPTNPNQGTSGAQAAGNIDGWYGVNPNLATLTGIVLPKGIDDPYVYNYYFGIQHEIMSKTIVEVNFVGTTAHKLFRAEDINRAPGAALPVGSHLVNNIGETLTGYGGRPNQNYDRLRTWENVTNSNYNSLQAALRRQLSHGLLFNVNYTYSHSIDSGSTWHYGATTANGGAGGDGFTTDPTNPGLDRGNSVFDIRHRLSINHVWQIPGQNLKGPLGYVAGGWSLGGIWAFQSGAHWMPFNSHRAHLVGDCSQSGIDNGLCSNTSGDYNLLVSTSGLNRSVSRPDSNVKGFSDFSHFTWANGWCGGAPYFSGGVYGCADQSQANLPVLSAPCLGCVGNLGRNTFVGPGLWTTDLTLSKNFKLTERFNLKFDAAAFNVFNRTNFSLATAATGSATSNRINSANFGKAGGDLGPRLMQFGLKLSF